MRRKKSNIRKNFFSKYLKSTNNLIKKAILILISMSIFAFIIYKTHNYAINTHSLDSIPFIRNKNLFIKKRFYENDGFIFSNQDKIVYNTIHGNIKLKDKNAKKLHKKVPQDLSHQQIFDIMKNIKGNSDSKNEINGATNNHKNYIKKQHRESNIFHVLEKR